tara:strand:+ start:300 stop:428 length:129 start_codon:yes stop_codon:yes gene_type:complete
LDILEALFDYYFVQPAVIKKEERGPKQEVKRGWQETNEMMVG